MGAKHLVNLFIRTFAHLAMSPLSLSEKDLGKTPGMFKALVGSKAFLEAEQFAHLPQPLRKLFCDLMVSTAPLPETRVSYASSHLLEQIFKYNSPPDLLRVLEGVVTTDDRGLVLRLADVATDLTSIFNEACNDDLADWFSAKNLEEFKNQVKLLKGAWDKVEESENDSHYLHLTFVQNFPVITRHLSEDLEDVVPGLTEFGQGYFSEIENEFDDEADFYEIEYDGEADWVEQDDEEEPDDEEPDEEPEETDSGDLAGGKVSNLGTIGPDVGEQDDEEEPDEEEPEEQMGQHYMTRQQRLANEQADDEEEPDDETDEQEDDEEEYKARAAHNNPKTGKPFPPIEQDEEPDDEEEPQESVQEKLFKRKTVIYTLEGRALKLFKESMGFKFLSDFAQHLIREVGGIQISSLDDSTGNWQFAVFPKDADDLDGWFAQQGIRAIRETIEPKCRLKVTNKVIEMYNPDPTDARNIYTAAGALNDPKTGKPFAFEQEPEDGDDKEPEKDKEEPEKKPEEPKDEPEESKEAFLKKLIEAIKKYETDSIASLLSVAKKRRWDIDELANQLSRYFKAIDPSFDTEDFLYLAEKWGVKTKVDPKEKGKYKDRTVADMRKQLSGLKARGPHKEGSKEFGTMKELMFAIRAKTGWGKVGDAVKDKLQPLQEKYGKITMGMMNAMGRQINAHHMCSECGLAIPVYAGRYPGACPNCGSAFEVSRPEVPAEPEAPEESALSERRQKYVIRHEKKMFGNIISYILDFDPSAEVDPERNPITKWVTTRLPISTLRMIDGVEDVIVANESKTETASLFKELKEGKLTESKYFEQAVKELTCPKCLRSLKECREGIQKVLKEDFYVDRGQAVIWVTDSQATDDNGYSIQKMLNSRNIQGTVFDDAGAVGVITKPKNVKAVKRALFDMGIEESKLQEQIPASDAPDAATTTVEPGTEPPPGEETPQSKSEPAKAAEQPKEVDGEEEGGEEEFKCPNCGVEIPTDDLKRMLGKLLHQIATQLEQGSKTDQEPETGAEEAPKEQEPPAETTPPEAPPSQSPPPQAPAAPQQQPPAESVNEFHVQSRMTVFKLTDKDLKYMGISDAADMEMAIDEWDSGGRISDESEVIQEGRQIIITIPDKYAAKLANWLAQEGAKMEGAKGERGERKIKEGRNKVSVLRLTRKAAKMVRKGVDPVTGDKLMVQGNMMYSEPLDTYFYESEADDTGASEHNFKPLHGELLVPAVDVPAETEIRIIDRVEETAFVEYQHRIHEVPAKDVLVFPEGFDLHTCVQAVLDDKMDRHEAARKRLHCREQAKRLTAIPEMAVKSNSKFMVAYFPNQESFEKVRPILAKQTTSSPLVEFNTLYLYPDTDEEREFVTKTVEDANGRLIQSRVAFGYDPNKPISEQIGSDDENADVVASVNDSFTNAYNNLKQIRQIKVDAQANMLKAVAMLQGAGLGKKTQSAIQKLATKMDIEKTVQEISKAITELNKAHDVFLAEFPDAKAQSEIPKEEPEVEVEPAAVVTPAEPPAEEPAPAPAPPAEPAPAPPAESVIDDAVASLKECKDMPLLAGLFEDAAPYSTIASIIRDNCPQLNPRQIQEVVQKLI